MTAMSRGKVGPDRVGTLPATLLPDRPKGDQLREVLTNLAGDLGPGRPIPSERVLAEHFRIARSTVRLVISRLVADGVLYRQHGSATFTAPARTLPGSAITSFTADMRARGMVPSAVLLSCAVAAADSALAHRLEIPTGAPIFHLARLQLADDEPLAVERTNLPLDRFPGIQRLDWRGRSLHQTLWDHWQVRPERNESSITATLPDTADATHLGVAPSQPCLLVQALCRAEDNTVIEAGKSIFRADRHAIFAHFHRAPPD